MSCNCPTPNTCPEALQCLCGIKASLYDNDGLVVEFSSGGYMGGSGFYYDLNGEGSPFNFSLEMKYNSIEGRWELYFFSEIYDENIVIGVYYTNETRCPISSCDWDLDCIALAFNILGSFDTYFSWSGEYVNGKKSYTFTSDWSGSDINYRIYWVPDSSTLPGSGAPVGTPAWTLEEEVGVDVWTSSGFLFNSNECPFGIYISGWEGGTTRYSFSNLGISGFDLKTSIIDCGCCDESVKIIVSTEKEGIVEMIGYVQYDEYGNVIVYNGKVYYEFVFGSGPEMETFYLFSNGSYWVVSESLGGSGINFNEYNFDCPYGYYTADEKLFSTFWVIGSECFDCCDYYTPRNRNLLKKKKAIFVDEISSIRNKEIFGMKCGPEWSDLFKKHLIFDVMWCLPYGVLCDDEEQCLINNLNENCNC